MNLSETDERYYRRRAAEEKAVADVTISERAREIHRELASLYDARADASETQIVGSGSV